MRLLSIILSLILGKLINDIVWALWDLNRLEVRIEESKLATSFEYPKIRGDLVEIVLKLL